MTREAAPLQIGEPFCPYRAFDRFSILPNGIRTRSRTELAPGAKVVYSSLLHFIGKNSRAWPSEGAIAKDVGLTPRQVRRHLLELEALRLVRITHRQIEGKVNEYEVLWHEWLEGGRTYMSEGVGHIRPGGVGHICPHLKRVSGRESGKRVTMPAQTPAGPEAPLPADSEPELRSSSEPTFAGSGKGPNPFGVDPLGFQGEALDSQGDSKAIASQGEDVGELSPWNPKAIATPGGDKAIASQGEDVAIGIGVAKASQRVAIGIRETIPWNQGRQKPAADAMPTEHSAAHTSLDRDEPPSTPTPSLDEDLGSTQSTPSARVRELQAIEQEKKAQTEAAIRKAKANRAKGVGERQAKNAAKEQKKANLKGKTYPPHVWRYIRGLEVLWRERMKVRWPDLDHVTWGAKDRGSLADLRERTTEPLLAQSLVYMIDRWESVKARVLHGRGTFPAVGMLVYYYPTISLEAQSCEKLLVLKAAHDEWVAAHPNDLYPPEDVLGPYQAALAEMKLYGLV